LGLFFIIV